MSERDADGELCPEATKLPTGFRERQASITKSTSSSAEEKHCA